MMLSLIVNIFKPKIKSLILFGLLSFICIGGVIQTYVFIDKNVIPKPPLYDILKPLGLWIPYTILCTPIHIIGYLLNLWWIVKYFPSISYGFKFPLTSIVYSYIISCLTTYFWDTVIRLNKYKKVVIVLAMMIAMIFCPPFIIVSLSNFIRTSMIIELISSTFTGYIFTTIVILTYIVILIGISRQLYLALKSIL